MTADSPIKSIVNELAERWTAPHSRAHFTAALTRKAWLLENGQPAGRHHEPLEWFGDRVIDLVVGQELVRRFPGRDEGAYDATRAELVGEPHLALLARQLDLLPFVRAGRGELLQRQVEQDGPLADHLEALCGAAFMSGGWDGAEAFVLRLFEGAWPDELRATRLDDDTSGGTLDPMSELTQLVNRIWGLSLDPKDDWQVAESGESHCRVHTATVSLPPDPETGERRRFEGPPVQTRKPKAKAAAARVALPYLRALAAK